mmetsp:Transcript_6741/g.20418  ORF Transcript_6741/g.20418 Transcript_6741/m.20418 type:complete len:299 (+) Transcript_6741:1826-2722(+)
MDELWIPMMLSNEDTGKFWVRAWVGYQSFKADSVGEDNSITINPAGYDLGERGEKMRRKFRSRQVVDEEDDSDDIHIFKAFKNFNKGLYHRLKDTSTPDIVRKGHDFLNNALGHERSASRRGHGIADLVEGLDVVSNASDGKQAESLAPVLVTFYTGFEFGAGTEGDVWIIFCGKNNSRSSVSYVSRFTASFRRGKRDMFCMNAPDWCLPSTSLIIGHEDSGLSGSWYLDRIEMTPLTLGDASAWRQTFPVRQWIKSSKSLQDGIQVFPYEEGLQSSGSDGREQPACEPHVADKAGDS